MKQIRKQQDLELAAEEAEAREKRSRQARKGTEGPDRGRRAKAGRIAATEVQETGMVRTV